MGNPKTDRKMNDFRIFCELLAKTMLKDIDFTDVLEVYRRNEKPEILGIATTTNKQLFYLSNRRNEKPEILGIATPLPICRYCRFAYSRNEKPEIRGIATKL